MKLEINLQRMGLDHQRVFTNGRPIGFRGMGKDKIALERCPDCGRENYAMAVLSGVCAWCGWDINDKAHKVTESAT